MAEKEVPQAESSFSSGKLYIWVKSLEGKVNNLLREVDVLKGDLIRKNNDLRKDVKTLSEDLVEARHELAKTSQKMDLIVKELKQTAGIEEVMTLKKYVDFWNPMNFVTQRDLERAVETRVSLNNEQKKHPEKKKT